MPSKHGDAPGAKPEQPQPQPQPQLPKQAERKPWKKKTPVEVVLDQEDKLRREIAEGEDDLKRKRAQLQKFEQARKIFEGS